MKSVSNLTVALFLDLTNIGSPHSEALKLLSKPRLNNIFNYIWNMASYMCGTG